jgi:hypothetical protein
MQVLKQEPWKSMDGQTSVQIKQGRHISERVSWLEFSGIPCGLLGQPEIIDATKIMRKWAMHDDSLLSWRLL